MRVTITKPLVFDAYGIAMAVGSIYTVDNNFGASLVSSLRAIDTDAILPMWLSSSTGVNAALSSGPLDDLGPSILIGYLSTTTRLTLTPAAGGTTINGLDARGRADNSTVFIQNLSATDSLTFAHLAVGSLAANRFNNMNGASVLIPPLGAARCTYVVNQWQFA